MVRRSLLFSPGDQPEVMRKAPEAGADVVVFDLEDAVAPGRKDEARAAVSDLVSDPDFDPDAEVCVRVNADPGGAARDLDAVLAGDPRLDSILLPMVEAADDVATFASRLRERNADLPVIVLCETAAGILHAEDIAAADPVDAVAFGAEDFAADVGAQRTAEGAELLYARQHVVLAAAAAGVDAIDTVFTDLDALDRLREEADSVRRLGYDGKLCIHPDQVPVVNDAFTPDRERIEWARSVLAAAAETDRGAFRVDGEMIDAPFVARAEQVRARARAAGVW